MTRPEDTVRQMLIEERRKEALAALDELVAERDRWRQLAQDMGARLPLMRRVFVEAGMGNRAAVENIEALLVRLGEYNQGLCEAPDESGVLRLNQPRVESQP